MQANSHLLLSAVLFLVCIPAQADQQTEQPSEELLDFLGQWEKVDDEWIDPTQLQEISMLEEKDLKGETDDQ